MGQMIDGWLGGALALVAAWLLAWGYCAATPVQMSAESDCVQVAAPGGIAESRNGEPCGVDRPRGVNPCAARDASNTSTPVGCRVRRQSENRNGLTLRKDGDIFNTHTPAPCRGRKMQGNL